ncbi:hypothetical protein LXL04_016252 [Taraxacum kok-saghyz]
MIIVHFSVTYGHMVGNFELELLEYEANQIGGKMLNQDTDIPASSEPIQVVEVDYDSPFYPPKNVANSKVIVPFVEQQQTATSGLYETGDLLIS